MINIQKRVLGALTLLIIVTGAQVSTARTLSPETPFANRLNEAETVFIGVVTNKVLDGDWARADLLIETPLFNAEQGAKVPVIWRTAVSGRPLYDAASGSRAIAILKDKHEGRYWLRTDKFENIAKLDEAKRVFASRNTSAKPGDVHKPTVPTAKNKEIPLIPRVSDEKSFSAGSTQFDATDRLAILNLINTYAHTYNNHEIEKWFELFVYNAVFARGKPGTALEEKSGEEFRSYWRQRNTASKAKGGGSLHLISNVTFLNQTPRSAYVSVVGLLADKDTNAKVSMPAIVHYEGWLVKQKGVWLISRWHDLAEVKTKIPSSTLKTQP
jgi:hypothetical protein